MALKKSRRARSPAGNKNNSKLKLQTENGPTNSTVTSRARGKSNKPRSQSREKCYVRSSSNSSRYRNRSLSPRRIGMNGSSKRVAERQSISKDTTLSSSALFVDPNTKTYKSVKSSSRRSAHRNENRSPDSKGRNDVRSSSRSRKARHKTSHSSRNLTASASSANVVRSERRMMREEQKQHSRRSRKSLPPKTPTSGSNSGRHKTRASRRPTAPDYLSKSEPAHLRGANSSSSSSSIRRRQNSDGLGGSSSRLSGSSKSSPSPSPSSVRKNGKSPKRSTRPASRGGGSGGNLDTHITKLPPPGADIFQGSWAGLTLSTEPEYKISK